MATSVANRSRSRAHPIHGILSAYPLALFTTALATDIAYARTAEIQWANFSVWLIAGGLFMAVLAAIVGMIDALVHRRRRDAGRGGGRRPWPHTLLTIVTLALALVNAFVHSRDAWTSVVPTGLGLSVIVSILVVVTSWTGYTLQARQEAR